MPATFLSPATRRGFLARAGALGAAAALPGQALAAPHAAYAAELGGDLRAMLGHLLHVERDLAEWDHDPAHEQFYAGYYPERALRERIGRVIGADAEEVERTVEAAGRIATGRR